MNARKQHPSVFAAADRESMHIGLVLRELNPAFLNCYTVLMNGEPGRTNYGHLLSWDDHPDASTWMHEQRQFMPGEALLVLEAQDHLLGFLQRCCRLILYDIAADELTSDVYPPMPDARIKTEIEATGLDSLPILSLEAPYRTPADLSVSKLEILMGAATAAIEDHIWALREDPSYFHDEVRELGEHRQEMVKDTTGRPHPIFKPHREHLFWHRVLGTLITSSYARLEIYSELWRQS
jgi:hypothetical protein